MDRISVKIIDYNKDMTEKSEILEFRYDNSTKFLDLINEIDFELYIILADSICLGNGGFCFKFLLVNGKFEWMVPFLDTKIIDYVNTYNKSDILTIRKSFGGLGSATIDWWQVLVVMSTLSGVFALSNQLSEFLKWAEKKLRKNNNHVPIDYVRDAVKMKNVWNLYELSKVLEMDTDTTKCILKMFGYAYDRSKQLYVFKISSDKEFKKLLDNSIEKVIDDQINKS